MAKAKAKRVQWRQRLGQRVANGTFSDGYLGGWKSVYGQGVAVPAIPPCALPNGKTEYQHGYDKGRAAATKTDG
jgi:hypothetical protein